MQNQSITFVIDDDVALCEGISSLLRSADNEVESFGSTKDFLEIKRPDVPGCFILDIRLPSKSGLELQAELTGLGISLPIVFLTGHKDVAMGVQAMKVGAFEFLCKPFREEDLLDVVRSATQKNFESAT